MRKQTIIFEPYRSSSHVYQNLVLIIDYIFMYDGAKLRFHHGLSGYYDLAKKEKNIVVHRAYLFCFDAILLSRVYVSLQLSPCH